MSNPNPQEPEALASSGYVAPFANPAMEQPSLPQTPAGGCGCGGSCGGSCPACAAAKADMAPVFIYAIGRIRPRILNLGLEKEITQAVGHKAVSSEEALHNLVSAPDYEYIASEMCWVFAVESVDAFVLKPTDSAALSRIIHTLRPDKGSTDVDIVIGRLGPRAAMTECNGAMLPTVLPVQVYSFDRSTFVKSIKRPDNIPDNIKEDVFEAAVKQTHDVMTQMSSNFGLTDGHRAMNYVITRYAEIYELVVRQLLNAATLTTISARPSALSGGRRVIEVVLTFQGRQPELSRSFFTRVDVTDLFPFLVSPLAPYYPFA